jgi:hypothetical protein
MPKLEKALRREARKRKEQQNETMGVRTPTLRAGEGLVRLEIGRKTKAKKGGKRRKK